MSLLRSRNVGRHHARRPGASEVIQERVLPQGVLAADLVPWWFAAAFWLAFAVLVVMVVRDVRRAGGLRRVWDAVQAGIERRAQPGDPASRGSGPGGAESGLDGTESGLAEEPEPLSGDEDPRRGPR